MGIVLVVGAAVVVGADARDRAGPSVLRVGGGGVGLEALVVGDVVAPVLAGEADGAATAAGGAVGVDGGEVEAAFEEAPGDVGGGELVADVGTGHVDEGVGGADADIAGGVG